MRGALALLLACRADKAADSATPQPGWLLSDQHGNALRLGELEGVADQRLSLQRLDPSCLDSDRREQCLAYQARPTLDGAGLALTWSTPDRRGEAHDGLVGRLSALDPELRPRWSLRALRWEEVDPALSGCPRWPGPACQPPPTLGRQERRRCSLYQPHDFVLIEESADSAELWVADTRNSRLLRLSVDGDSDCAQVRELISAEKDPAFAPALTPNSMVWGEGDGPYLGAPPEQWMLWTTKDSEGSSPEGLAQGGGRGKGRVALWRRDGGEWSLDWQFPDPALPAPAFLNAPHGVTWGRGPGGELLVAYAHSLGLGSDWDVGEVGTVGLLIIEEGGPRYIGDLRPEEADLYWPRDVHLEDGGLRVISSGCKGASGCSRGTEARILQLPPLEPSDRGGSWSAEGSELQLLEQPTHGDPLWDEAAGIYSGEPISAELAEALRRNLPTVD